MENKERRRRKKDGEEKQTEIFAFNYFDCEGNSWDSGARLDIKIVRALIYKSSASLECVYLGAAPIT